jgi:sulfatase maturation enzyme AslB (radical SAM superfamily)
MRTKAVLRVLGARLGFPVPLAVGFEITHLCNLSCHYCDRHTPLPNEMTYEQIERALFELKQAGMQELSLDGGEPLTHRHIGAVVEQLLAWGIVVRMNTNGILVPKKLDIVRRLQKLKISLDGPAERHDAMRGKDAFRRAIAGANAARDAGVPVEFTCVVGRHNHDALDELMDLVDALGFSIIFQPARNSLFLDNERDGSAFMLENQQIRAAFAQVEARKRRSQVVLNGWSSLRHFRSFPSDVKLPCAAGHINVTLDPEGHLFHCGQVSRMNRSNNVVRLGVAECLGRLQRRGCSQCWCARVVEENYAWGGHFARMLPARE